MQDAGNGRRVVEIGYLFRQDYWHNGYATEAAQGCKRYAFETLGVPEVSFHHPGQQLCFPTRGKAQRDAARRDDGPNTTMGWTCPISSTV